jgi:hypothetical protein
MYFRPLLLWVSGLSSWSPISMSAIPSVTSPLAGPTKCDKKSLILSIRAYKRIEMWIGRLTDLFQFHNSRVRLSLGGTSRVSVYKTRQCDVTASVTGRVCSQSDRRHFCVKRNNGYPSSHPNSAMSSHLPRPKPVVFIDSLPPGSSPRKRKLKEEPSDASTNAPLVIGQPESPKKREMYVAVPEPVCHVLIRFYSIPSAKIEVLLPPLGSWKSRLLGQVGNQRHVSSQRTPSAS